MIALGIEGTAHTLGVGIVSWSNGEVEILANARDMMRPEEGGIHPREAAHHHQEWGPKLLAQALEDASLSPEDIDVVSFSQGPGLGPCLRIAATMARAFSLEHGIPLVGVNHCVAHLEIGRAMTGLQDPCLLYASGANTQVIAHTRGRYRVFGETLDIGIGNMLDKFARDQGIPFPGGPEIERLAKGADPNKLLPLPYAVKGMDLCLSGVALAAQRWIDQGERLEDVCFAIQETAFAALVEITERAMAHTGKTQVVLGGGVGCNGRLQEMLQEMAKERGGAFASPPRAVLVDNGAMIAFTGALKFQSEGATALEDSGILPQERTDDVVTTWRT